MASKKLKSPKIFRDSHYPEFENERFVVVYHIVGNETDAHSKAQDICVEQTIEFPLDLVSSKEIKENIVGKLETFSQIRPEQYQAIISFPTAVVGREIPQLLNVLFGNTSIKPGIRISSMELPLGFLENFKGPRFGRQGIRDFFPTRSGPLLCTALKPMGLTAKELGELATQFALGGVDIIKDDHGLADQSFCPFQDRVETCSRAVAEANSKTGGHALYVPNLIGPMEQIKERALFARDAGAGGLLAAPGLIGMDTVRHIADSDEIGLPIIGHPALLGSFLVSPNQGISHLVLLGHLKRREPTTKLLAWMKLTS